MLSTDLGSTDLKFKIKVGKRILKLNFELLMNQSKYNKEFEQYKNSGVPYSIESVSTGDVLRLNNYLINGQITITESNCMPIFHLSKRLGLTQLEQLCIEFFQKHLTTCFLIQAHYFTILKNQGSTIKSFKYNDLKWLLKTVMNKKQNPNLMVGRSVCLLKTALLWSNHRLSRCEKDHTKKIKKHFIKLLKIVQWGNIPIGNLRGIVLSEKNISPVITNYLTDYLSKNLLLNQNLTNNQKENRDQNEKENVNKNENVNEIENEKNKFFRKIQIKTNTILPTVVIKSKHQNTNTKLIEIQLQNTQNKNVKKHNKKENENYLRTEERNDKLISEDEEDENENEEENQKNSTKQPKKEKRTRKKRKRKEKEKEKEKKRKRKGKEKESTDPNLNQTYELSQEKIHFYRNILNEEEKDKINVEKIKKEKENKAEKDKDKEKEKENKTVINYQKNNTTSEVRLVKKEKFLNLGNKNNSIMKTSSKPMEITQNTITSQTPNNKNENDKKAKTTKENTPREQYKRSEHKFNRKQNNYPSNQKDLIIQNGQKGNNSQLISDNSNYYQQRSNPYNNSNHYHYTNVPHHYNLNQNNSNYRDQYYNNNNNNSNYEHNYNNNNNNNNDNYHPNDHRNSNSEQNYNNSSYHYIKKETYNFGKLFEKEKEIEKEKRKEKEKEIEIVKEKEIEKKSNSPKRIIPQKRVARDQKIHKSHEILILTTIASMVRIEKIISNIKKHSKSQNIYLKYYQLQKRRITFTDIRNADVIILIFKQNHTKQSPNTISEILVRYIKDGGNIIICSLDALQISNFNQNDSENMLTGEISEPFFLPVKKGKILNFHSSIHFNIPTKYKNHPIFENVDNFTINDQYMRIYTDLFIKDCYVQKYIKQIKFITKWNDGVPLIVIKKNFEDYGSVSVFNMNITSYINRNIGSKENLSPIILFVNLIFYLID